MFITSLASPASTVRITARCYYCTHSFIVEVDPFGQLGAEDASGRLCCEDCFCSDCGGGHFTAADQAQCTYLFDYASCAGEEEFAGYGDSDAAYDRLRDQMMDLELTS